MEESEGLVRMLRQNVLKICQRLLSICCSTLPTSQPQKRENKRYLLLPKPSLRGGERELLGENGITKK